MNEGEASLTANTLQRLLQLNEGLEPADIAVIVESGCVTLLSLLLSIRVM
jgi:hypothetical protein